MKDNKSLVKVAEFNSNSEEVRKRISNVLKDAGFIIVRDFLFSEIFHVCVIDDEQWETNDED